MKNKKGIIEIPKGFKRTTSEFEIRGGGKLYFKDENGTLTELRNPVHNGRPWVTKKTHFEEWENVTMFCEGTKYIAYRLK